jgi:hypothetical protein
VSLLHHAERPAVVLLAGASAYAAGLAAGVSSEQVELLKLVAGGVVAIVAAVAWIDYRIDGKIKRHGAEEARLNRARHRLVHKDLEILAAKLNVELPPIPGDEEEEVG